MKISVIIPAYNEENNITETLESLLDQSRSVDEIIVVDNNSRDNTVDVVRMFEDVILISESKQGISHARNKGFSYASGDILVKVDADTIVSHDWAERIEKAFLEDENRVGLIGSALYASFEHTTAPFFAITHLYYHYFDKILHLPLLYGPSEAIRASIWHVISKSVDCDDKNIHEDVEIACKIHPFGTIHFDRKWIVYTSTRRILGNPKSFFFDYPRKLVTTYARNWNNVVRGNKNAIARIMFG
jgi:glycosyltransferase involved in cell wall biosynthesis